MAVLRTGLMVVLLWIGGLKFASYEADSIVPLIANSPFANFMSIIPTAVPSAHEQGRGG